MLSRRSFLARTGAASLGVKLSSAALLDFCSSSAFARDAGSEGLRFGPLEPLVELMCGASPDEMLHALVAKLRAGTELKEIVAAAALANARTFGGEDYDGYHCFMALMPALAMAQRTKGKESALPVLKVVHRSAARMAAFRKARTSDVLGTAPSAMDAANAQASLEASIHRSDLDGAEHAFAAIANGDKDKALRAIAPLVREEMDVHRIVLAWRAYETLSVAGDENASTFLRQCVHFCASREKDAAARNAEVRELIPRLMKENRLAEREIPLAREGANAAPYDAIERLAHAIYRESRADAALAMTVWLRNGFSLNECCEALSLAATRLLIEDHGVSRNPTAEKPLGSVHGASIGVHASDSALAWRELARALPPSERAATLLAAAYHTGGQSASLGEHFSYETEVAALADVKDAELLARLESAIGAAKQAEACATAERFLTRGGSGEDLLARILPFAIADDGALHAEKYFFTAADLYTTSRVEFRNRHLVTLARVAASQHVKTAESVVTARALLEGRA